METNKDLEEYSRVTNTEYGDARDLDRELEEMRAQHDEEERSAAEAAKELERERRELQDAADASSAATDMAEPTTGLIRDALVEARELVRIEVALAREDMAGKLTGLKTASLVLLASTVAFSRAAPHSPP